MSLKIAVFRKCLFLISLLFPNREYVYFFGNLSLRQFRSPLFENDLGRLEAISDAKINLSDRGPADKQTGR